MPISITKSVFIAGLSPVSRLDPGAAFNSEPGGQMGFGPIPDQSDQRLIHELKLVRDIQAFNGWQLHVIEHVQQSDLVLRLHDEHQVGPFHIPLRYPMDAMRTDTC